MVAAEAPTSDDDATLNTGKRVAAWLDELETAHGVGPDGFERSVSSTGDPYVTIAWGLDGNPIKGEGNPGAAFKTLELAWSMWAAAFLTYLKGRSGRIHWRKSPNWTQLEDSTYMVFARVFVEREPA